MKIRTSIIFSLILALSVIAETQNIESKENLKSETNAELKEVSEITNKNNPVDIFKLVRSKIEQEKYDEAAIAYLVANAYGYFDAERVADRSAHQAIRVLQMNLGNSVSQEEADALQEAVGKTLKESTKIMEALNKVGKPTYHPTYMIQHGMGAFTGNKTNDGLVPDFDSDKAWKELLDSLKS